MRIAITGGTGFVGRHLAERFPAEDVVLVSRRTGVAIDDVDGLARAFEGCAAVAHCAGINRELGEQTFQRVHVDGTAAVIEAARRAGVERVVLLSFLRARPGTGSPYHESKWTAEEAVRVSGLDFTVLKAGMIYGRGDHLVDHISHAVQTLPLFATVGFRERPIRPVPVEDMVDVLVAAVQGRLPRSTFAVTGAEELLLSDAVRRIARVLHRPVLILPAPVLVIRGLAQVTEWTMRVPLIAKAQARMLAEGVAVPAPPTPDLPGELRPSRRFTEDRIRAALPPRGGFALHDLRLPRRGGPDAGKVSERTLSDYSARVRCSVRNSRWGEGMTVQAEAQVTRADQGATTETAATSTEDGPLVYLGMRRGWWVVVSLLVLVGVDLIPMVGPYLSLVALMWMISGLARAEPRPERLAPRRPAAQVRRTEPPGRAAHAERGAALPSS